MPTEKKPPARRKAKPSTPPEKTDNISRPQGSVPILLKVLDEVYSDMSHYLVGLPGAENLEAIHTAITAISGRISPLAPAIERLIDADGLSECYTFQGTLAAAKAMLLWHASLQPDIVTPAMDLVARYTAVLNTMQPEQPYNNADWEQQMRSLLDAKEHSQ